MDIVKTKSENWDYYQELLKQNGFVGITDLLTKFRAVERESDELRAKLAEMESKPVPADKPVISEWQSIDTHPKSNENKKTFMVYCPDNKCQYMVYWDFNKLELCFWSDGYCVDKNFSHWSPLRNSPSVYERCPSHESEQETEIEIPYPEGCKICNVATGCDGSCY